MSTVAACCAHMDLAHSQDYPSRTVKVIVPFPAGGGTDKITRVVTERLAQALKQPFVIDNRGGASANIGAALVAKSPADGHTILVGAPNHTANISLYQNLGYDILVDLVPVTMLAATPLMLVVHPSLGIKDLRQLIDYAKKNPDKLAYASNGAGSAPHLAAEMFCQQTGTRMTHIPYRGSAPAVLAALTGEVQVMFGSVPSVHEFVKVNKLIALGVTSGQRTPLVPEVPTLSAAGLPGYEMLTWYGFFVPKGTPPEVIRRLYESTHEVLEDAEIRNSFLKQGYERVGNTPSGIFPFRQAGSGKTRGRHQGREHQNGIGAWFHCARKAHLQRNS